MQDFHVTHSGKKLMREQCYGPQDLALGAFIHVYGRDFFIHDADDFTKQWYSVSACVITDLIVCIRQAAGDFTMHTTSHAHCHCHSCTVLFVCLLPHG